MIHNRKGGGGRMARRGSYGAEKRQKELRKKKKREEKLERKRLKKLGNTESEPEKDADDLAQTAGDALDPAEGDSR